MSSVQVVTKVRDNHSGSRSLATRGVDDKQLILRVKYHELASRDRLHAPSGLVAAELAEQYPDVDSTEWQTCLDLWLKGTGPFDARLPGRDHLRELWKDSRKISLRSGPTVKDVLVQEADSTDTLSPERLGEYLHTKHDILSSAAWEKLVRCWRDADETPRSLEPKVAATYAPSPAQAPCLAQRSDRDGHLASKPLATAPLAYPSSTPGTAPSSSSTVFSPEQLREVFRVNAENFTAFDKLTEKAEFLCEETGLGDKQFWMKQVLDWMKGRGVHASASQ